jgi:ABC-type transport system involved in multi-copper enzyme maturation permease subunit
MKPMDDFGDWLSPIAVKELRQGLRSRVFVSAFLLLHVAMLACVIGGLASEGETINALVLSAINGIQIIVLPLRGASAFQREMKENTLELLLLTRLSAWRIVFGKWLALTCETLLLLSAALPYIVLGYFFGGVDLTGNLSQLLLGFVVSAILTAATVSLSPLLGSLGARILFGLGLLAALQTLVAGIAFSNFSGHPSSGGIEEFWPAVFLAPLAIAEFLEMGAGNIAPFIENHATRKRLYAVGLLVLGAILDLIVSSKVHLIVAFALAAPAVISSVWEPFIPYVAVYQPFVRRGAWGWAAGRFFYPGWPAGLFFSTLILILFCLTADPNFSVVAFIACQVLVPAAILSCVGARPGQKRSTWIWALTVPGIPMVGAIFGEGFAAFCGFLGSICLLIMFTHSVDLWGKIRLLESLARQKTEVPDPAVYAA